MSRNCGKRRAGIVQVLVKHSAISMGGKNNSPTFNGEHYGLKVDLFALYNAVKMLVLESRYFVCFCMGIVVYSMNL